MSDRELRHPYDDPLPKESAPAPRLPDWLARRLLRHNEEISLVCGPRSNPTWERYLTHPALIVVALALGAVCLVTGRLLVERWSEMPLALGLAVIAIVFGAIFVLALASAHFTRLVVTNHRLLIMQGYEVCRGWDIDDLPPSLIRYDPRGAGDGVPAVDLTKVRTLLGGASGQFAEAKSILELGKQLDRIKLDKKRRSAD